ncbi:hypothetical protein ATCC90586_010980 [Pythium insidiosum]|nr:hypothetical protein ATCC90586_010980 [Pythium insidiosum]
MLEARFEMELKDERSGKFIELRIVGLWEGGTVYFYVNRGMESHKYCFARVSPTKEGKKIKNKLQQPYLLEVAPGMDVALVVLVCGALDEEFVKLKSKDKHRYDVGDDAVTQRLRHRHVGLPDLDERPHRREEYLAKAAKMLGI